MWNAAPATVTIDRDSSGFTIVELLVSMALTLVLLIGALQFIDFGRKNYKQESDQADIQASARAILELMSLDIRQAGYSPFGAPVTPVPSGDAASVRLLADLDGDGVVGIAGEVNENVTWVFDGPSGSGLYTLLRGVDLNGDGDFGDADETVYSVLDGLLPVDLDGDGTNEPFLQYDAAPPATESWVRITFGMQSDYETVATGESETITLSSQVALRNLMLQ